MSKRFDQLTTERAPVAGSAVDVLGNALGKLNPHALGLSPVAVRLLQFARDASRSELVNKAAEYAALESLGAAVVVRVKLKTAAQLKVTDKEHERAVAELVGAGHLSGAAVGRVAFYRVVV